MTMTKEETMAEYKKLIDLVVKCIASTPVEYHDALCIDLRIPPSMVAAALSNGHRGSDG